MSGSVQAARRAVTHLLRDGCLSCKKVSPPLCFPSPGAWQVLWLVRDFGLVSLCGGLGKGSCSCHGGPSPAGGMERGQHGAGWSSFR